VKQPNTRAGPVASIAKHHPVTVYLFRNMLVLRR